MNLKWGTRSENQRMRVALNPGSYAKLRRITDTEAGQIKSLYSSGDFTQGAIAKHFGIHFTTVNKIVRGRLFGQVPPIEYSGPPVKDSRPKRRWQYQLAQEAGITKSTLSIILTGRSRPAWETAKKLARATETKPDFWMDGTPPELRAAVMKYLQE